MDSFARMPTLGLLVERPCFVNELPRLLAQQYGEQAKISGTTAARVLDELQATGYAEVCAEDRRPRRLHYQATASGRRAYSEWAGRRLWDGPLGWEVLSPLTATGDMAAVLDALSSAERHCLATLERASTAPGGLRGMESLEQIAERIGEQHGSLVVIVRLASIQDFRAALHAHADPGRIRAHG